MGRFEGKREAIRKRKDLVTGGRDEEGRKKKKREREEEVFRYHHEATLDRLV